MMNYNNNNIVLCGNSIEDLENGLVALKSALATGAVMGVGGSSIEEVEAGLDGLRQMVGEPACPYQYDCATCDECECNNWDDEDEDDEDYDPWADELDEIEDDDYEDEDEDEDEGDPDEELPEAVKAVLSAIIAGLIDL